MFKPLLDDDQIGPASVDLKLGKEFRVFNVTRQSFIDTRKGTPPEFMQKIIVRPDDSFVLHPHNFVLANTCEYVKVGDDVLLRVAGKSTLARMGILVHTAGFVDLGFEGTLTIEISNQSNLPVVLYSGMYICQIAVEGLSSPAEIQYNKRKKSLYLKQKNPTEAKTKNLFKISDRQK